MLLPWPLLLRSGLWFWLLEALPASTRGSCLDLVALSLWFFCRSGLQFHLWFYIDSNSISMMNDFCFLLCFLISRLYIHLFCFSCWCCFQSSLLFCFSCWCCFQTEGHSKCFQIWWFGTDCFIWVFFYYYFETLLRPDVLKVWSKFLRPVVHPVLNVRLLIPGGTRLVGCPVLRASFVRS